MRMPLYNEKNEYVGDIDDSTYWSQRDNYQSQVFRKFGNALAISNIILKRLLQHKVKIIAILVANFKPQSFYAVTSLTYFLNHSKNIDFNKKDKDGFDRTHYGKQKMMEMDKWKIATTIDEVKRINFEKQMELI